MESMDPLAAVDPPESPNDGDDSPESIDPDFAEEMMSTYRDFITNQYCPPYPDDDYIIDESPQHQSKHGGILKNRSSSKTREINDQQWSSRPISSSQIYERLRKRSKHWTHKEQKKYDKSSKRTDNKLSERTRSLLDDFQSYLSKIELEESVRVEDKEDPPEEQLQEDPPYELQQSSQNYQQRHNMEDLEGVNILPKKDPPYIQPSPLNNRRYFAGETSEKNTSKKQRVKTIFDRLRSSKGIAMQDDDQILWVDEMGFFEATNGRNEVNLHNSIKGSNTKGRSRCARAAIFWPKCQKLTRNLVLTCAAIGSLVAIILGTTMQKKNLPNIAMIKHKGTIHKPNWFDRPKWQGQTYAEAVMFCEFNRQRLCDYDAICPFGLGSLPITSPDGAFHEEDDTPSNPRGVTWLPISDAPNSWVHVGPVDRCLKYDYIHSGPPSWGLTGEDNEEITRHIVCCPPVAKGKKPPDELPVQIYKPLDNTWYDRADGWNGSTIEDAHDFCSTKESRFACPYESYCPKGPHYPPVEGGPGLDADYTTSWAPIIDEIGSGVVLIGREDSGAEEGSKSAICKAYHVTRKDDLTAIGLEESTHVMCCR